MFERREHQFLSIQTHYALKKLSTHPTTKRKSHTSPAKSPAQPPPPPPPPPPVGDLEVDVDEINIYEQYALREIMELSAHYAALDTEEPDSEDDASAAASLGDDADDDDEDDAPRDDDDDDDEDVGAGFVYNKSSARYLPEHDPNRTLRSALRDENDENDYGDVADDDDDDDAADDADDADDAAADDAAADFGAPRESPLDVADAFAIADALADLAICDERDARAIAVALTALEDGPEDETERAAESLREAAWHDRK